MQHAPPYRSCFSAAPPPGNANPNGLARVSKVKKLVSESPVVVLARRGCCMCHVAKLLLNGHGVYPTIFEIDEQNEAEVTGELARITGNSAAPQLPAVFVGGKFYGGLENIMGAHISGELVPQLKAARALWL